MRIIVLLGANGDIAQVAQHYVNHIPKPDKKPLWVVGRKYEAILRELYAEYFDILPLNLPQNNPLLAAAIAKKRYPMAKIGIVQQNGADPEMKATRGYNSYQHYQIAQLTELFA